MLFYVVSTVLFPLVRRRSIHVWWGEPRSSWQTGMASGAAPSILTPCIVQLQATCGEGTVCLLPSSRTSCHRVLHCWPQAPWVWWDSPQRAQGGFLVWWRCPFPPGQLAPHSYDLNELQAFWGCKMIFRALGFSSRSNKCVLWGLFPCLKERKCFSPN